MSDLSFKDSRKLSLLCRVGSLCWLRLWSGEWHSETLQLIQKLWVWVVLGAWPSGACSSVGSAPGGAVHTETPTLVSFLIRKIFMEEMMMLRT